MRPELEAHASKSPKANAQDGLHGARLLPHQPPGRRTRKALPFSVEIRRLHALGYTLEAIRQALSEVGVSVSRSTVHREASRRAAPATLAVAIKHADTADTVTPAPLVSSRSTNTASQSGKDVAEAFFNAHPSNPLFPTKENS
ncbi:MAG: hypothetical protein IAE86_02680 [Burkholderiaceae bacterium]|nr:hypothetical protein [Burkholderiaceae bacterium]